MLLLASFAFSACSSDDGEVASQPALLTVEVSENPMQDDAVTAPVMTNRAGDATTTESLSGFYLSCSDSWKNVQFTKGGSGWSTTTWPLPDDNSTKIDFYAYSAGTFYWNSGNPYVSFTMEEAVASQKDFLIAKHPQVSYSDNNGKVTLTFDHACAAVQFYVYKEENTTFVVKEIKLKNVKKSGSYYFNNDAGSRWTVNETTTDYTLTTSDISVTTEKQLLPCNWLYIIPQSKDDIKIDVTYTKNGGTQTTKTLSLSSGTWTAGTQYTVNIKIGK